MLRQHKNLYYDLFEKQKRVNNACDDVERRQKENAENIKQKTSKSSLKTLQGWHQDHLKASKQQRERIVALENKMSEQVRKDAQDHVNGYRLEYNNGR